jgi:hypothetical protein
MPNAWNVTEEEFKEARKREQDQSTSEKDKADYWQLMRFFRGQLFYRDAVARAVNLIRKAKW